MSTLDQLFEDIDQETQEKKLQKCINFAHRQKYNYARFKKLIDMNLKFPDNLKWEEDDYIKEYNVFVTKMYQCRWDFNTQQYFNERYNVPVDAFIRVNDDLSVGKKLYTAHGINNQ